MKAAKMFDSTSQRDLKYGIDALTEVKGSAQPLFQFQGAAE
jgi:hypothetical protein